MTRLPSSPARLGLAVLGAVALVLLPTLLVALAGAAGPDAPEPEAGSLVSAAPVAGASRVASLADTVRLEAWAPAPGPCAAPGAAPLRGAPGHAEAAAQPSAVPSPAAVARRL